MQRSNEVEAGRATPWVNALRLIEAKFAAADRYELDPDRHTIVCVRSGSAVLDMADRHLRVNEGELLLIGSQNYKSIVGWRVQSAQIEVLAFCRSAVVDGASITEGIEYLRSFESQAQAMPQLVRGSPEMVEEIGHLIGRIRKEAESPGAHSALTMKTYLKMILVLLCRQSSDAAHAPVARHRDFTRLQPLLDYLAKHYMEVISVDQAAQVLNMSNSHFMRYFRHTTGSAFVPYLNRLRISKAQELMGQSRLSIAEVGELVGFCDHSYFSCIFRRVSGIGPREYRNEMRKGASH